MKQFILILVTVCSANLALMAQSMDTDTNPLVSAVWLNNEIQSIDNNLVILDVRNIQDYDKAHIPGAQFADYASWFVKKNGLPGYLPSKDTIQTIIRKHGIDDQSHVVVVSGVDKKYTFGRSARIYWTLKISGLDNLSILDGGMQKWNKEALAVSTETVTVSPSNYVVSQYDRELIENLETTKEAVKNLNNTYVYIDARPAEQYEGYKKHKFARIGGTIKGAVNLSQYDFTNADGMLKSRREIETLVDAKTLDPSAKVVTFCNMGHGSATNWFVFSEILGRPASLYDGSYNEWSADKQNPVANQKKRREIKEYYKVKKQS